MVFISFYLQESYGTNKLNLIAISVRDVHRAVVEETSGSTDGLLIIFIFFLSIIKLGILLLICHFIPELMFMHGLEALSPDLAHLTQADPGSAVMPGMNL